MSERSWAPLGATGPSLQIEAEDNPTMVAEGGGQGPHIHTLHAEHYLLQNQGSFSFWHLPGLNAIASKRLVNFQIFAHYSGHNSYLKGLLVNWDSQGEQPGALEMTSEDCRWRAQTAGHGWHDVDGPEHLSAFLAVGQDQGHLRVEMLMPQTEGSEGFKNGFKKVAHLYTMCKPGHHINVKIIMFSQEHVSLVQGQLGRHSAAKATVATVVSGTAGQRWRRDQEFLMNKSWMELGGTFGAAYLKRMRTPTPFWKAAARKKRLKQGELVPNSWVSLRRIQRRSASRNISLPISLSLLKQFSRIASLMCALVAVRSLLNWQENIFERLSVIVPWSDDWTRRHNPQSAAMCSLS